jgi:imidazolonepropionase-like amidohydrolase
MDALVAATQTNSKILRIDDLIGTLEVGKMADIVAWTTDPLESPKAFTDRDQAAVIFQSGATVKDIR